MFVGAPSADEIISSTRTTTGTLATVPAGKWYTAEISISASVSVLGASTPTVSINGTNAGPTSGSVVARLNLNGLALTTVNGAMSIPVIVKAPPENAVTVDFTAGANGTSSATINGIIFG